MMASIGILLPLSVIVGDYLVGNVALFDKYTLYFKYFKECVPSNVFLFALMVAVLTGIGYLFDKISETYGSNKYMKVFSIGTLMFLFFIVISLFQNRYIIDVMRIGVIFGFQGIILFVFIFLSNATKNGKVRFSIILSIFIFIVLFYAILGLSNAFPYNSDTIVPWKSGATYRERIPD
jgi:UDP-N-acetylglucosamine:LPS N-acetylglucosamine transferase